ncbi:MAG: transcription antitermination factor NusB [Acidobacteria bacterium]|nr:transcription antitermination factor NusB [Acidobacteriota bacterium]MBI3663997.1 transcription antitermination factor NusB [Acidobacteriota bacterium]
MALRSKAREYALQMLFQWEMTQQEPWRVESGFWKNARSEKNTRVFANQLFEGAVSELKSLDELIVQHASNWRLDRMAAIDRAILRLATHELRRGETPYKVVLDEAVELAKTFSSAEAPPFINGVLDAVHKAIQENRE